MGSSVRYDLALEELGKALKFGIDPSLDGIRALMDAFGNPQERFASIQIAGTNGKSSSSRMIAALLHEEGFHVGLYTSPELVEYPERIEVDQTVVDKDVFAGLILEVVDKARELKETPGLPDVYTEFEILTAAGLLHFAREQVDFAVLECGMGGRWDATSVAKPSVALITGIGLDHMHILGNSVREIAAEKAAIIRPATSVVLGPGCSETKQLFLERCRACDCHPRCVEAQGEELFPEIPEQNHIRYAGSAGERGILMDVQACHARYSSIQKDAPSYQLPNVACAIAAAESALGRALDPQALSRAIASVRLPGRFETLRSDPLLIIDAAHNPQGAQVLARALQERFPDPASRPSLLLAVLGDKDAAGIIKEIVPYVSNVYVSQTDSPRAMPKEDLADLLYELTGRRAALYDSPASAVEDLRSKGVGLLACGSITLAGAVAAWAQQDARR